MNNLEELEVMEMPVTMAQPLQASYLKESARIPLGQLSQGRTSRTIRNNMRGIKFHDGPKLAQIGVAPNARNFAKHGTRSVSPQPMKLGGRSTARRASRHARRKHGRRYRSRHIRR
jgi:hypothetical protein